MAEKKPRKRVTALRVDEISLVDRPAVPKARFLIVKRDQTKGGDGMKLEEGQVDAEVKATAELAKEGAEEVSKQQIDTMKEARGMIGKLMLKRNDLPGFFRRMVMEMDIALDEFMREREAVLGKADAADAEGETTEEDTTKRGEEDEKPKEETEEKAEETKPEEESEEKAGHKDGKKQEEKKCPPFLEFDPESGKCVPKKKKKGEKAEKVEENEEESAPRDDGSGDLKSAETLELSAAQKKRVDKLIEKFNKK